MRLHFIRHAESEANVIGGLHCSVPGPGLSPNGRSQAIALAQSLRELDLKAVYASTMTRAHLTAAPIAAAAGLPVQVLPGVHETHLGDLDGRCDDEAHQIFDELFTAWMLDDDLTAGRPGGETGQQVLGRLLGSVDQVLAEWGSADGDVVLVSHGAALRIVLSRICPGVTPSFALRHHLPNTGRVVVVVDPLPTGQRRLTCVDWAGLGPPP